MKIRFTERADKDYVILSIIPHPEEQRYLTYRDTDVQSIPSTCHSSKHYR